MHTIRNFKDEYPWDILKRRWDLPLDIIKRCIRFDPIPMIYIYLETDEVAFKYIFKNENNEILCSYVHSLKNQRRDFYFINKFKH